MCNFLGNWIKNEWRNAQVQQKDQFVSSNRDKQTERETTLGHDAPPGAGTTRWRTPPPPPPNWSSLPSSSSSSLSLLPPSSSLAGAKAPLSSSGAGSPALSGCPAPPSSPPAARAPTCSSCTAWPTTSCWRTTAAPSCTSPPSPSAPAKSGNQPCTQRRIMKRAVREHRNPHIVQIPKSAVVIGQ